MRDDQRQPSGGQSSVPGGNTFPGNLLSKRSTLATEYQVSVTGGLTPSPNATTEAYLSGLNPLANVGGEFHAGKKVVVNVGDNFVSCTHAAEF